MIGKTIFHYRIIEKLGEGGMGVVYRAEDTSLRRTVALKFLPPHLTGDPQARERFIHEAQAAAALNHPGICTVHEIGEADGGVYIAMECIEGQSLREELRSGSLDPDRILSLAIQVAEALQEAHDRGIVHRDIKPSNIMVTPSGRVKITDFGLAKVSGSTAVTQPGTVFGTVAYMSPEQAGGKPVDHRTDLWSLGVAIYEMIEGRRPFDGDNPQVVIHAILHSTPPPLTSAPPQLELVVSKALARDAEDRYQRATELIEDLKGSRDETEAVPMLRQRSHFEGLPSIAVMPFADMSPERDQEYFCDGVSEEIINALTGLSGLRVIARTSAFSFKGKNEDMREIGRKLDVTSILEGSVRKAGDRVRITAQLIDVADGSHVWSERYDRVLEDVFAVQDEIAAAIVQRLRLDLSDSEKDRLAEERRVDPEAHDLYLRGRHLFTRGFFTIIAEDQTRVRKAIEFYEKAAEVDPGYAAPHASLAGVHAGLCRWVEPKGNCERARLEGTRALELDDSSELAHIAMSNVALSADLDWNRARTECLRALELNPGSADAQKSCAAFFTWAAEFARAIEHAKKALALDPLDYDAHLLVTFTTMLSRRACEESIELSEAALELFPGDKYFESHILWGRAMLGIDAEEIAQAYGKRWPSGAEAGVLYAMAGRREDARRVIERMEAKERRGARYGKARVYAALGEKDEALRLLKETWEHEPRVLLQLNSDPELDCLRGEQRFKDLVKRSGIPMGELAYLSE
jgi:serine/threonine protein kinase